MKHAAAGKTRTSTLSYQHAEDTECRLGQFAQARVNRAHKAKLGDEPALAFLLAWLANHHDERDMFDWFWRSRTSDDLGQTQNMSAALNGIRRIVGEKRFQACPIRGDAAPA